MSILGTRAAASLKALGFAGAGKPLAPTIGTNTRASTVINVVFTPGYNGGAPVTYTATSTPGNYIFTGSTSPITATGMTLGTAYTFTVYATNVYGSSPSSASSNSLIYASVPLAPTLTSATIASSTSVTVTFTAPASNGGEPITQYTAVAFTGGISTGISATIFQAVSGSISVTGLTSGTTYTFKVLATNALGDGVYSNESDDVTPDLPTYTISTNLLGTVGTEFVDEGANALIYIDTNTTVVATTLYWSVAGTGITVGDFVSGSLTGSVSITPTVRSTVTLGIRADGATEGTETFIFRLYTDSGRTTLLSNAAIGGYVIGDAARNIQISDTSTVSYTLTPNTSSVNEGQSVTFSATRSDSASSTAYWSVQAVSGTVNSSDLSTSGSVSISSGSGSFIISITSDQVTEGTESFRILLYSDSGRTLLVAISSTVTINDTSLYPAAGTWTGSSYCQPGFNLYYIYHNGSGGTYDQLVQTNSPTCGYVAPTLAITVNGPYSDYTIFGPNSNTKSYYLLIFWDSSALGTQPWSVSGLTTQTSAGSGSSGTFGGGTSSAVPVFKPPHSATYVTVTVSRSEYTSFSQSYLIPANSVQYSPYTYASGFVQEFGWVGYAGLAADLATLYTTNNGYFTSSGQFKYGLYRRPDSGGLNYWMGQALLNGWNSSSQGYRDAILNSSESQSTQPTSFGYGTGYGDFLDKP